MKTDKSHRLDTTVGKDNVVGTLDGRAIRVLVVAEVGASVVVLHTVSEVVRDGVLSGK